MTMLRQLLGRISDNVDQLRDEFEAGVEVPGYRSRLGRVLWKRARHAAAASQSAV